MAEISVVIPVYNAKKYLKECLDSILFQTFGDFEVICIDDGSSDASADILKEYAAKDGRITVTKQPNRGVANARNAGLEKASGRFIIFLDADDFFERNMLFLLRKKALETNADIVLFNAVTYDDISKKVTGFMGIKRITENNVITLQKRKLNSNDTFDVFLDTNSYTWNKFYKLSFIKERKIRFQNISSFNDVCFTFLALGLAEIIAFVDKAFIYYRVNNPASISRVCKSKFCENIFKSFQALEDELRGNGVFSGYEDSFYRKFTEHLGYLYNVAEDKKTFLASCYEKVPSKYLETPDIRSFFQKIFSVRNHFIYKVITIFGIRIKLIRG